MLFAKEPRGAHAAEALAQLNILRDDVLKCIWNSYWIISGLGLFLLVGLLDRTLCTESDLESPPPTLTLASLPHSALDGPASPSSFPQPNAMIYLTTSPLYHTYLKGALGGGGAAYEGGAKTKFKFDKGSVDFGTDG